MRALFVSFKILGYSISIGYDQPVIIFRGTKGRTDPIVHIQHTEKPRLTT